MKAPLLILVVIFGGLSVWLKLDRDKIRESSAIALAKAEDAAKKARADLDKAEKALVRAEARIEALTAPKAGPATAPAPVAATNAPSKPVNAPEPQPQDKPAENDASAKLAELDALLERKLAEIDGKAEVLTRNRQIAQDALNRLESNPPAFAEQSGRFDANGNRIGSKGVRTSDKDRQRAMEQWEEQKAPIRAQLAAIAQAEQALIAERKTIHEQYNAAVDRARAGK